VISETTEASVINKPGRSASLAALRLLATRGIDVVFGNPGTTELPLIKDLARVDRPRYVLTLHEGTAVSAAAGNALATGRPGVAIVHAMPGLANGLSMYYDAWRAGVPLVLIAGTQDRRLQHLNPVLHADLTDVARAVSKAVWEVKTGAEIPGVVARALQLAATPPTGPVFLSIPIDAWSESVDEPAPLDAPRVRGPGATDNGTIEELCDIVLSASVPVMVTGDVASRRRCETALAELAELIGARAYWAPQSSLASFPSTSLCYRGPIFPNATGFARAFDGADLLLAVGAHVVPTILFERRDVIPRELKTVSISEAGSDEAGILSPELCVHGDLSSTLERLRDGLHARIEQNDELAARLDDRRALVLEEGASRRQRLRARALGAGRGGGALHAASAVAAILDAAPPGVMVAEEAVSNSGWVALLGDFPDSLAYLTMAKGGALGYALGLAIGAKISLPNRPAMAILGDGSLMYSPQGLWTMANEQLPIVACVLNNEGYAVLAEFLALERFSPEIPHGEITRTEFAAEPPLRIQAPSLDVANLARSFGIESARAEDVTVLGELVRVAFASGRPWLIDVPISWER
jgi:benzoylformate decarboxylase